MNSGWGVLILEVALIGGVAWFVISPIVLRRGERAWSETSDEARLRSIGERKTRLYSSIVELDFDRDSGKLSSEDHARMRAEAMNEVLVALQLGDCLLHDDYLQDLV